jgi:transcriptional regulator with XRE-family HTH domain
MTQAEIKTRLHRLRYEGHWSIRALARESGLSPATMSSAMNGTMSAVTQTRLSIVFKAIAPHAPITPPKRKPGHKKRYLIRYYNLTKWLDVLENEQGIEKKFKRRRHRDLSKVQAAHVCVQLDYIMKRYLLDVFGEELKKAHVSMGDNHPVENWVEQIQTKLTSRRELVKKLLQRRN